MPESSTGRRPVVSTSSWRRRYRSVFEYWINLESETSDDEPTAEPETPSQPPAQPATPSQPPAQPATPSQPPAQPATPSQPPAQPATPSQPPAQPATPSQPPVQPATPSQPPAQPVTPSQPQPKPEPSSGPGTEPKPEDKPVQPIKPEQIPPEVLKVVKVNLNKEVNHEEHNTSEFDIAEKKLIVRRGQMFYIDIEFNRPYDKEKDDLRIVLQFGPNPIQSNSTHVEFILSDKDVKGEWGALLKSSEGNVIKVGVISPATCYVGRWMFKIDVVKVGEEEMSVFRYSHRDPIYVLFNPWCKEDEVYMHDTELLKEYILTEFGVIFVGSIQKYSFKIWNFGQFESIVLDCCMYLLEEKSKLPPHVRGSPMAIIRKLSALVNSSDESGVLTGNWSGDYEGGTSPLDWNGSVAILKEYYETKKPVKFGQCWVFSAIFTTVGRALGIPIRSVTNFESAHDTDGTITIDKHFDEEGEPLEEYNSDSIWNFHVWNDAWMTRPDLPAGYGGWQAVDATPQETSGGIYCMGPMSLKAIKRGEVFYKYDGAFVFGEVNADVINWKCSKDGSIERINVIKNSVGRLILTKKALELSVDNVTEQYKYPEGSKEERAALYIANMMSSSPDAYPEKSGARDVDFEASFNPDTFVGDKIVIDVTVANKSEEERIITGTLKLDTVYYTGVHYRLVAKEKIKDKVIPPGATEVIGIAVEELDYLPLLMDHCMLTLGGLFLVKPTNQYTPIQSTLRLRKPHLSVKGSYTGDIGKTVELEVIFTNPLSVPLTNCSLMIEGASLQEPLKLAQSDVEAKGDFVGKFEITPKKKGRREISIAFNSKELRSIVGSHAIYVL